MNRICASYLRLICRIPQPARNSLALIQIGGSGRALCNIRFALLHECTVVATLMLLCHMLAWKCCFIYDGFVELRRGKCHKVNGAKKPTGAFKNPLWI